MKTGRRIALLGLLLLLCAGICAFARAEGAESVQVPIPQLYETMTGYFEQGDRAEALRIALLIEERNPDYADSAQYIAYLKGLEALQSKDIAGALSYFELLVPAKFQNAEGYYAYAKGLSLHAIGRYAEALTRYEKAVSLGISCIGDYAACREALNNANYQTAQQLETQQDYMKAALLFEALEAYQDSALRAKENYYRAAAALAEGQHYEEAAEVFVSLGAYRDSVQRAQECAALSKSVLNNRCLSALACREAGSTTLALQWEDDQNLNDYTVTYAPKGMMASARTAHVAARALTLEGLIPDTAYTVEVTSGKNAAAFASAAFKTAQAAYPDQADNYLGLITLRVCAFSLRSLGNGAVEELVNRGDYQRLSGDALPLPESKLSESGTGYLVQLYFERQKTQADQTYAYQCAVRFGEDYVCALQGEARIRGDWDTPGIVCDLTLLLDEIYQNAAGWPGGAMTISFYVNGKRVDDRQLWLEQRDQ